MADRRECDLCGKVSDPSCNYRFQIAFEPVAPIQAHIGDVRKSVAIDVCGGCFGLLPYPDASAECRLINRLVKSKMP